MGQNTFMRRSESRGEVADPREPQTQENPREREGASLKMTTVALGAPSEGDKTVRAEFCCQLKFIFSPSGRFEYRELFWVGKTPVEDAQTSMRMTQAGHKASRKHIDGRERRGDDTTRRQSKNKHQKEE